MECTDLVIMDKDYLDQDKELKKKSLTPFHPLINFEIQEYFKDENRFNGAFSRNNLPKLKNGAYVIHLYHSKNTGTHWIVIFMKNNEVIYFDSFGVEYIPKEMMEKYEIETLKQIYLEFRIIIQ